MKQQLDIQTPASSDALTMLGDVSDLCASAEPHDYVYERIVRLCATLLGSPVCSIYVVRDSSLVMQATVGLEPDLVGEVAYIWGQGIPGWVANKGKVACIPDVRTDSRYVPLPSHELGKMRAVLCVPLQSEDRVIGAMTVRRLEVYTYTDEQRQLLELVAAYVAARVARSQLKREKIESDRMAAVAVSLSEVAHYIKNVLFTAQLAERQVDCGFREETDMVEVQDAWRTLAQTNEKIRRLVESMLNYCGTADLQLEPVDLNELIEEIIDGLQDQTRKCAAHIELDLDPKLPLVRAQRDSIHDALLNLVTNSLDAVASCLTREITVRTGRVRGKKQVRIDVVDTGIGIPEAIHEKIFNLFFSTKGKKGSGIGLAATRRMIGDHGGTIDLVSTSQKGTHFSLVLPIR